MELVENVEGILSTSVNNDCAKRLMLEVVPEMWKKLRELNGIGLTAIQVGEPWALSIYQLEGGPKVVFFNGQYTDAKRGRNQREEGCLSYPDRDPIMVKRPKEIWAKYEIWTGEKLVPEMKKLKGFEARVFQHEVDHQMGKTIYVGGRDT